MKILKTSLGLAVLTGLCLGAWGFWWEPRGLVLREAAMTLPGWPAGHAPLRIALLSDLHAGAPYVDAAKIERAVALINGAGPDLVVLLGDYTIHGVAGGRYLPIDRVAPLLGALQAPLGTYAVLGNHDWWDDAAKIAKALTAAGIVVLDDQTRRVARAGGAFWLAGLADFWERAPDVPKVLGTVSDAAPVIALTHNPDVFPELPSSLALTLAGHTHGGQVNLPLLGRPVVPSRYGQRYAYGAIEEAGKQLFVTSGLGTSIIPVRLAVPPEVVVLTVTGRP